MSGASLPQMFAGDPQRFEKFSLQQGGLLLDYSKNLVTAETMQLLAALARERGLAGEIQSLFNGGKVNPSENRPALHTALRDDRALEVDGVDVMPQIQATLARMRDFSDGVRAGTLTGRGGAKITDVVHVGIGGSHLGPALATRALAPVRERGSARAFLFQRRCVGGLRHARPPGTRHHARDRRIENIYHHRDTLQRAHRARLAGRRRRRPACRGHREHPGSG